MRTKCPACDAEVTVTVDGDVPDFPIRVDWYSEIPGRHVGVVVVDSHEPVSELYHWTGVNACEITVEYYEEFLGCSDMHDEAICIATYASALVRLEIALAWYTLRHRGQLQTEPLPHAGRWMLSDGFPNANAP